MSRHKIEREDIDALLEFLPRFEQPGRVFASWSETWKNADGSISLPFPEYGEDVQDFFRLVAQHGWLDYGYKPEEAARMLADGELVGRADVEQLKAMLTYCLRGERFCEGFWETLLHGGQIAALLRRLRAIREQMD